MKRKEELGFLTWEEINPELIHLREVAFDVRRAEFIRREDVIFFGGWQAKDEKIERQLLRNRAHASYRELSFDAGKRPARHHC